MVTIYALECTRNGKVYIGCTAAKLSKRMREHRCLLKGGKHAEPDLQADFNLYGAQWFQMIPILVLEAGTDVETKRELEKHWMAQYEIRGLLYNRQRCSFEPPVGAQAAAAKRRVENGYSPSAETRLKRRLAQLGKPKNHGAKISATKQAKKLMR